MPKTKKLYCYVDETGQDTKGGLFLVAVIIQNAQHVSQIKDSLEHIETSSGKKYLKWMKTRTIVKESFVNKILKIKELKSSVYYSHYFNTKGYPYLIALTIAKAILYQKVTDYEVTIIIDGLNKKEKEIIKVELKKLGVRYRKIRGMKDEQEILLRLADAMAGFFRNAVEGQEYTKKYLPIFEKEKIIINL